jgi:NADPH:quinone reductase-like Zn-dependent oxidoreductase
MSPFVDEELAPFLARLTPEDLEVMAGLMADGKVTAVIDRRYRLDQVGEAIGYLEEGHARGKVILAPD